MKVTLTILAAALLAIACGEGPSDTLDAGVDGDDAAPGKVDAAEAQPDAPPPPDASPPDAQPLEYDCENLPPGPFSLSALSGPIASEDLAFDDQGNLVGSNDSTIFKSPYNGSPSVFVPSFQFRAGLRFTPNGDLVVNDDYTGSLVRVDSGGVKHTVLSGLSYPNGLTVDLQGFVYLTEHDANRVRRVDPKTGEFTVISEGQIANPNGITFNPDHSALYIDGFSGEGTIYRLPISADGEPGQLEEWATDVGTGWLDGLAVDACGNVYVCDYEASRIYRISPDGKQISLIIEGDYIYMPNMQWGSGIGGWDEMKLYIPDGWDHKVYEVDIGVPSKPRAYP